MAKLRTEKEKEDILEHCIELEKTGGDILGYLRSMDYLTPRATWFNLQREMLGRERNEFTDGKPTKKHERTEKEVKHKKLTNEEKRKTVQIAIDGGDPRKYLGNELGILDPQSSWWKIKTALKTADPDLYAKLPERLEYKKTGNYSKNVDKGMPKQDKKPEQPATVKVSGPIRIETEKPEEVTVSAGDAMKSMEEAAGEFFGKCEMGLMKNIPKITEPVSYDGLEVSAVRHPDLGEFHYDRKYKTIDWRTPEGDEVSLGPVWWQQMAEDLPKILRVLGVYQE